LRVDRVKRRNRFASNSRKQLPVLRMKGNVSFGDKCIAPYLSDVGRCTSARAMRHAA
jgi:hypothetical protein